VKPRLARVARSNAAASDVVMHVTADVRARSDTCMSHDTCDDHAALLPCSPSSLTLDGVVERALVGEQLWMLRGDVIVRLPLRASPPRSSVARTALSLSHESAS